MIWHSQCHIIAIFSEIQIRCVTRTSIDSIYVISSPNSMFDHLLESSRRDDSYKWSNIEFDKEIGIIDIKIRTLSGALIFCLSIHRVFLNEVTFLPGFQSWLAHCSFQQVYYSLKGYFNEDNWTCKEQTFWGMTSATSAEDKRAPSRVYAVCFVYEQGRFNSFHAR